MVIYVFFLLRCSRPFYLPNIGLPNLSDLGFIYRRP